MKKAIQERLNAQIQKENAASFAYLALATWAEGQNLPAIAAYFYNASEDERSHMLEIFKYVNEQGGEAVVEWSKEKNKPSFKNILEVFEYVFELEHSVTTSINQLADWCVQNSEHATYLFLQPFILEQQQAEKGVTDLINMIKRVGFEEKNLFYLDHRFEKINLQAAQSAKTQE